MPEPVRLVIWDLDGTFWGGTLTEGGYVYSDANHNIVVELAKRGIVSSICSKNDFETIKAILVEKGLWDYFVFPSINWNPKGPRLKQLVEDIQLRPATVLLIDDNALNLKEAEHFVPGIQTADEKFIPEILGSPLFKGKNDAELLRLKQYQLLETRKSDEAVAEDNVEFLRSCDIRVTIERDIEEKLDRAIELINRTNQLNFTKRRLPDDVEEARRHLLKRLSAHSAQAGLVKVTDRYGDYGYCGFFLVKTSRKGTSRLVHYCFSCRILNMGVENWVYTRLGRPDLEVVGEVLTDLSSAAVVDWINIDNAQRDEPGGGGALRGRVFIRGACSVSPLAHYFKVGTEDVIGEFHEGRGYVQFRRDHSLMLRYGIERRSPEQMDIFRNLGFLDSDFETAFADTSCEPTLRILCNWADGQDIIYRHKKTGLLVPYKMKKLGGKNGKPGKRRTDPINITGGDEEFETLPEDARKVLTYLHENFERVGPIPEDEADRTLDAIFDVVPPGSPIFIVAAPETGMTDGVRVNGSKLNRRMERAAARHPSKMIFNVALGEYAEEGERQTSQHFDRSVYYRLYQSIWARYRDVLAAQDHNLRPGAKNATSVERAVEPAA